MNNRFNYKKINFIIDIVYIFTIILSIYIVLKYLFGLFIPFIIGFVICFIAEPTINILCTRLKMNRTISSVVCILTILILFVCITLLFSTIMISQIKELASLIPDFRDILNGIAQKESKSILDNGILFVINYMSKFDFNSISQNAFMSNMLHYSTDVFKTMPQFIMSIIVTLAFSIILSSSFPSVKNFIKRRFSYKNRILIHQIKICTISVLKNYFKSYSILLFITFIELLIAFFVFKIKPIFALAFIISLIDILPIFGIGTVMLPWGIILIALEEYQFAAIILSIYCIITVIRQIIEPKIVGNNIGLPAVITLPIMFIGLNLFGFVGLFAGPAIATVIYSLHKKGYIYLWK